MRGRAGCSAIESSRFSLRCLPAVLLSGVLLVSPCATYAQSLGTEGVRIMRAVAERRQQQLERVDLYVKRVQRGAIPGLEARPVPGAGECSSFANCDVFQVETVTLPDGTTTRVERQLSPQEVSVLAGVNPGSVYLDQMGQGLINAQQELNSLFGVSAGAFTSEVLPVWLDPTYMLMMAGVMAMGAANATANAEASLASSNEIAQADANQMAAAISQLEAAGSDTVGGIRTAVYRNDNLSLPTQSADGAEFNLTGLGIWIDPENLVVVKHRFEGTAVAEGQSREFFIEVENADFRNPPGCGEMYEPFRRTMRMGGMLDAAQMAEMEQARAQLAEFEQQMASMPAQQRQMMERMMGSQLETMRSLVSGGAIENTEQTDEILCNPDLASLYSLGGAPSVVSEDELLRQIQLDLVALGYMPGNTDGVLDTLTEIAISQFQAEQGLEVTGQPSAALASVLAGLAP